MERNHYEPGGSLVAHRTSGEMLLWLSVAVSLALAGQAHALPVSGDLYIKPIVVPGAANNLALDVQWAQHIYKQVGLNIHARSTANFDDPNANPEPSPSPYLVIDSYAELDTLLPMASSQGADANDLPVFYVEKLPADPGMVTIGFTRSPEDGTKGIAMTEAVLTYGPGGGHRGDTLAHEIGHFLMDKWRYRVPKTGGGYEDDVHATDADRLMCSGGSRTLPAAMANASPAGNLDLLAFDIGHYPAEANSLCDMVFSLWNSVPSYTGYIQNMVEDDITVSFAKDDALPSKYTEFGFTGGIPLDAWGTDDVLFSASARKASNTLSKSELNFLYQFDDPLAGAGDTGTIDLQVFDIDWVDADTVGRVTAGSLEIKVFDDNLDSPVTLGASDYSFSMKTDGPKEFGFDLGINKASLVGKRDVQVFFAVEVPEPATLGLLTLGTVMLIRGRRKR